MHHSRCAQCRHTGTLWRGLFDFQTSAWAIQGQEKEFAMATAFSAMEHLKQCEGSTIRSRVQCHWARRGSDAVATGTGTGGSVCKRRARCCNACRGCALCAHLARLPPARHADGRRVSSNPFHRGWKLEWHPLESCPYTPSNTSEAFAQLRICCRQAT